MNRLAGKVVVVTAGYGDIGRATCRRCCEEGATVIMTGRKPVEEGAAIARATQDEAHGRQRQRLADLGVPNPKTNGGIVYRVCDSAGRDSIDALFADLRRDVPRLDVVIGNAALVYNEPFLESKQCYENDPKFGPRTQAVIPLREFGTVDQCADAFLFLASDEADYITGTTLLVDGGASIPRRD
jgi:NAD(P)-dependent dehydrogenase (short-subunit alcohol dehydrogenase family)